MNTEQIRAELLPCPFCGRSVSFHQDDEECRDGCHYIECKTCGTFDLSTAADPTNTVEDLCELRAKIAPLWNRRAALQSRDREDAERIQFMADDACTFNTWKQEDGSWKYRLEWDHGTEWQTQWFDSPVEAIDHARRAEDKT